MDSVSSAVVEAATKEQRVNPLVRRIRLPGETFAIPSKGLLYEPGEVLSHDVVDGELHIYPMTGIDELTMKSVDKLFSGEAVNEVFARCIPQVLNPSMLFAKDVDYLLTALRKVSFGPTIELTYTHNCDKAELHTYEAVIGTFLQETTTLNPVSMGKAFKFDCHGQQVTFKPAVYGDMIKLYQASQQVAGKDQTDREKLTAMLVSLATVIKTVDEESDRDMIVEWLDSLPVMWLTEISEAVAATTNWGIEFDVKITCMDCGEELIVPTTLNPVSFFI